MVKEAPKTSLLHLSVEQENLASIPFAVLERRVGKRVSKISIPGTKVLPDGTEVAVCWQIQGNSELGLPTEQDLDIFVALGVLTFRHDFAKTVVFSGREIAKILGIKNVHGKFYQRLKMAMDRFIPLRFRGVAATDRQEEIKWVNVFQEASFTLDRDSGRCMGSVTWTDKLIQSMNNGFFRVLDASRYMELDGITAKHLYRFLAVAFQKSDLIVMDARKLATDHIGMLNPPKYLSRMMQTLEPALDQLIACGVLGSYHIFDSEKWEVALYRHKEYIPEHDVLLQDNPDGALEFARLACQRSLERSGLPEKAAETYAAAAKTQLELYLLERGARLIESMTEDGVLPHVATGLIRKALDAGCDSTEGRDVLDWAEIAIQTCRQKKVGGEPLKNPAGLIVKLVKDPDSRRRIVSAQTEKAALTSFRKREQAVTASQLHAERHALILQYERFRDEIGRVSFGELSEHARTALRKEKVEYLRQNGGLTRGDLRVCEVEVDEMICRDLAKKEAPPFEKWYLRTRARQTLLPLSAAVGE
jgi:hypothetical protein